MAIFHLVRHASHALLGQVLVGRSEDDVALSEEGIAEASALARRLSRTETAAVYSSPLRRARETATEIARHAAVDVIIEARLNEVDFGEWTDRSFERLGAAAEWRHWNAFRSGTRAPGGETIADVQARFVGAMIDLANRHGNRQIVLVSHGDPIKSALAFWLGIPFDHFHRLEIAPASITRIALDKDGVRVLSVNEQICDP